MITITFKITEDGLNTGATASIDYDGATDSEKRMLIEKLRYSVETIIQSICWRYA